MPDVYAALVPEIRDDPASMGYEGKTDAERLALLTAKARTRQRRVPSLELLAWGGQDGRLSKVRKAAQGLPPFDSLGDELRSAAIAAEALITRADAGFDPRVAEHAAVVGAMVAASVFTPGDRDSLLAVAVEPCSRADELGLAGLGLGHLESARLLLAPNATFAPNGRRLLHPHQQRALAAKLAEPAFDGLTAAEAFDRLTADKNLMGLRGLCFAAASRVAAMPKARADRHTPVPDREAAAFPTGVPGMPNFVHWLAFSGAWKEAGRG